MLKLVDITKEYKVEEEVTLALKDVSIEFRKNEFVSILGPSGCGKTTLLNIVGGLDRYTSGDIQIDGISTKQYDDVDWDTYRNKRVGFVFQSYNLIPHMNILKNVALCLTLSGVDREERRERAMEALRKVGLESQAKKKPMQLSGGQMQRVAIARALVNNPDIILADEPTGALDTESGIQVMDLLKEVAKDRLVVMVTHNPQLAEEYSTRIVYLKDGEVVGDTMPYDSSLEVEEEEVAAEENVEVVETAEQEEIVENVVADENAIEIESEPETKTQKLKTNVKKAGTFMMKLLKRRQYGKSAMKLGTAINLSWNNLISKKGRTLLTSIAGSIGIIGIILVLSLSNGATAYINGIEEDALSSYPLTVSDSSIDAQALLDVFLNGDDNALANANDKTVYIKTVLGDVMKQFTSTQQENDLNALKKYIDENLSENDSDVRVTYDYGTTFNAYVADPKSDTKYMKVNPYTDAMYGVLDNIVIGGMKIADMSLGESFNNMTVKEALGTYANLLGSSWSEMSTNQKLLDQQYDIVKGHWPENKNEVVIVVDEKNQLQDIELFMLGLKSQDDVGSALLDGKNFASGDYSVDDLLNLKYYVMTNADYLTKDTDSSGNTVWKWPENGRSELDKEFIDSKNPLEITVSAVVRKKANSVGSAIGGVIGYTKELGSYLLERASNHEAIKAQTAAFEEAYEEAIANDKTCSYESVIECKYTVNDSTVSRYVGEYLYENEHKELMRELGVADIDYPQKISFYCSSFDAKEKIEAFLKDYNEKMNAAAEAEKAALKAAGASQTEIDAVKSKAIKYTDTLSQIMGFVDTMATTITGVLVAFAGISLIVSTIMIAIIIYTSVLERRKEIGVLRSIGARKKDISRVFLAESAILGGYSGIIGLLVSYLISLLGSFVLDKFFGIEGLMTVEWWHCLMMFLISIVLSMLAGFIPSRIASNKDPAIALRSE